jgi:hypothetical protein
MNKILIINSATLLVDTFKINLVGFAAITQMVLKLGAAFLPHSTFIDFNIRT